MTLEELLKTYPTLYHMAEDGSWVSIERFGLLSTIALLDLFEIYGEDRDKLLSEHRPDSVTIRHPDHGVAVIRDQKPMTENRLAHCLMDGITPRKWYELINQRVFFWLSEERLLRLLSARAYRGRAHTVLHIHTRPLVEAYADSIELTPINSGNTLPVGRSRGRDTFRTIADYPFDAMCRTRKAQDAVAELSVLYGVPNIRDFVTRVERRQANSLLNTLVP
ncbi:MAG: hypothetical protein WD771_04725 [Gemmatimonadaceae bacterium]